LYGIWNLEKLTYFVDFMTVAKLVENAARQLACEHRGLKKLAEGAAPLSFEISGVPTT
jgi:hypothetical protein